MASRRSDLGDFKLGVIAGSCWPGGPYVGIELLGRGRHRKLRISEARELIDRLEGVISEAVLEVQGSAVKPGGTD